jgi:hypothetical protein
MNKATHSRLLYDHLACGRSKDMSKKWIKT